MHTGPVGEHQRRFVTVKQAIVELGVGKSTVYRWVSGSKGIVARDKYRLPDSRGRHVLTLVVDVEGLRRYGDTQDPGRPSHN